MTVQVLSFVLGKSIHVQIKSSSSVTTALWIHSEFNAKKDSYNWQDGESSSTNRSSFAGWCKYCVKVKKMGKKLASRLLQGMLVGLTNLSWDPIPRAPSSLEEEEEGSPYYYCLWNKLDFASMYFLLSGARLLLWVCCWVTKDTKSKILE